METISASHPSAVTKAAAILRAGGVILYPTDTLYGLGVDALSDEAVAKVYAIKGRDEKKPLHAVVADMDMASKYGEVNETADKLARAFLPGPLTLILKKKEGVETGIGRERKTFGIRIPDNQFCRDLALEFGKPFTTTSANIAGATPERSVEKILAQLGGRAQFINLIIDAGELPEHLPSTVVDVSDDSIRILREGAIASQTLLHS